MSSPLSIKSMGLERYLNFSAAQHKGMSYADFVKLVEQDPRPSNTKIAEKFGVTYMTIANWLRVYEKQKEVI